MSETGVQGRSWDLKSEYPAADSPEIEADLAALDALLEDVETQNATLTPLLDRADGLSVEAAREAISAARAIHALTEHAVQIVRDTDGFAQCSLSVDSEDEAAQRLLGRLQSVQKRFANATEPLDQFLNLVPDEVVEAYLADETTAPSRFAVEHARKRRHELLPLDQETLVNSLGQDGIHAWGRLYDQLSGTLTCEVPQGNELGTMGIAQASGLMLGPDDREREAAWRAINVAWDAHAESCAAAINAIAGWRLEMCRQRSGGRPVHYLDAPVHLNKISRQTLDTVLAVAEEGVPLARRAAQLQAKAYGKASYGPWDQRAPAPVAADQEGRPIPYDEAVDLIAESYGSVAPEMGDFVRMMAEKQWIEGTVGPRKRPRRLLHRISQVAHAARLHDLFRWRERCHHARPRTRSCLPRLGDARLAGQPARLRHVHRRNGEHVRRDRGPQRAAEAGRDAGCGTRHRVGGSRRAGVLRTEHSGALRVRAQLLRCPRRAPAGGRRNSKP